jgi:hypothetical protein
MTVFTIEARPKPRKGERKTRDTTT